MACSTLERPAYAAPMPSGPDGRRTAEQTFAILTASYHQLPELTELIEELTEAEAKVVVRALAALLNGTLLNVEAIAHVPHGAALPRIVQLARERLPWLDC